MAVDFSLFSSGGGGSEGTAGLHFANAAIRVFAAQVVTVVHLAVPSVVFGAAANSTPSFEDGQWHWRYTASHLNQLWTAHLSGSVSGSDVNWGMRITAPQYSPPLEDFLWFGGTSRVDGTSGTWRFYDPESASSSEVVRVDWTHISAVDHSATITVTGGTGDNVGDVLAARREGASHTLNWTDASEAQTVEIGWDHATGTGYIVAPGYNGGLKACWNANQEDVACS